MFSPSGSGPDEKGIYKEKEVAAVHYSADKMDPHGRYVDLDTDPQHHACNIPRTLPAYFSFWRRITNLPLGGFYGA